MLDVNGPRLKIQRANKHIADLHEMLLRFANSDFYTVSIEHDPQRGINFVLFEIDPSKFPLDDAALTIGDALHNLRSALDHLYYQVVLACGGTPTKWTRFPIFDTEDRLVATLNGALEQRQITVPVVRFTVDSIKPHQGGNPALWGLHNLNIRDKHEILVPVLKLVLVDGVHLEDNEHRPIGKTTYIMDESSRIRLRDADDRRVTVRDKGHASASIYFNIGTPFGGDGVIPTLKGISEEVTRTVEAFQLMLP
jgi:hypothetical protein